MTFITEKIRGAVTTAAAAERPLIDLKWTWIATVAICAFFIGVREYEQMFGWKAGMDSYSGEFQTYWMPVLYIFTTLELIAFLGLVFYLFRTRDLDVAKVEPREELRRIFYLLVWILLYGIALYWGASYFSEQEAAWNQALVRDSAFTPVNIIQYYVADPIYIITGIGGLLYARTRLPTFACHGWSTAYVLLFIGPLMLLPCAALNEWGSTVWIMEELAVAPLHWGFVFFGWFSLSVFGVSLLIIGRIRELSSGYEDVPRYCPLRVMKSWRSGLPNPLRHSKGAGADSSQSLPASGVGFAPGDR